MALSDIILKLIMNINKKAGRQFIKFCIVGVLNTAIDFLAFNGLTVLFGLGSFNYVIMKAVSFLISSINSFLLNKNWVFKKKSANKKTALKFLSVASIGLLINTAVAVATFKVLKSITNINTPLVANLGVAAGVGAVMLWNFFGYKLLVFKK